ncbi:MAG: peptide chain release factor N(5)-glutamine methyltransferase [Betaproteobacteria bacterium]|jgi:release factor glutamine methyltransferase|nr:peptide chain release factor N(5)-glutamine methyltransferase [Betaproteobacteria bacterium]
MSASIHTLVEASGLPKSEARLLVAHALGVDRAWLVAHANDLVDAAQQELAGALLGRRQAGEPIAYILGHREFHGLDLAVTPDVLIPRPETELLVDLALARMGGESRRVLDLGTGSGAIAIAIAHSAPRADVWAADASAAALALARANAARHAPRVHFVESDWFAGLIGQRFGLVLTNPPYVAADDPHLQQGDVRFEPRAALVGGADGLDCIRRVISEARDHLAAGGWLLLEHGHEQGEASRALLAAAGYSEVDSWPDLAGIPRVSGGRR